MARDLQERIVVSAQIEALDPLHVGSGRDDVDTDLACSVDGQHRLYAAGTGLAGAFRHWCVRRFDNSLVNQVWGFQSPGQAADSSDGHASYLTVDDAVIQNPERYPIEIRDHVGIDREWGAAAESIKFDRAVVPKGATLPLEMALDLPRSDQRNNDAKAMLGHLLQALQDGQIRIGGAKSRGLGRIQLKGVSIREEQRSRAGLLARLRGQSLASSVANLKASSELSAQICPGMRLRVHWQPIGPLMVKSGVDGLRIDSLPLLGGINGLRAPLIPGSSVKGALRSQAERIVRTLCGQGQPAWRAVTEGRKRFLEQLDESHTVIHDLFGFRSRNTSTGGQGSLAISDCFANSPVPAAAWDRMFFEPPQSDDMAEQDAFDQTKARTGRMQWQKSFHVAIDRWTAGSAEHLLYQVLEPLGETWSPFEMDFDLDRIGRDPNGHEEPQAAMRRTQAWVLLLLTLRDLAKSRIPIGFGGNRGLGEINVTKIDIEPVDGPALGLNSKVELPQGNLTIFDERVRRDWDAEWKMLA